MSQTKFKVKGEQNLVIPVANVSYTDKNDDNRKLTVKEVVVGDLSGREVRGILSHPGNWIEHQKNYACDLNTFNAVWVTVKENDNQRKEASNGNDSASAGR